MSADRARTGDTVRASAPIPLTWSDRLIGGGVQRGRRGVVTGADRGRVQVTFDGQRRTVSVRQRDLNVVGRPSPPHALLPPVKIALAMFTAFPTVQFLVAYLWEHHGIEGILIAFANHLSDGMIASVAIMAADPLKALGHMIFMSIVTRYALR